MKLVVSNIIKSLVDNTPYYPSRAFYNHAEGEIPHLFILRIDNLEFMANQICDALTEFRGLAPCKTNDYSSKSTIRLIYTGLCRAHLYLETYNNFSLSTGLTVDIKILLCDYTFRLRDVISERELVDSRLDFYDLVRLRAGRFAHQILQNMRILMPGLRSMNMV
jgi:hypothetical protein